MVEEPPLLRIRQLPLGLLQLNPRDHLLADVLHELFEYSGFDSNTVVLGG